MKYEFYSGKRTYNIIILCLTILVPLVLSCCGKMDVSGKYKLSDSNEAVMTDKTLKAIAQPDDHARVFYEIFTGSFSDSDGDGIGDLRGIINHMDYLNDGDPDSGLSLGIEGIWLTPIFRSPSYHKYDTTDYYKIDPDFGTEEDLAELIRLCHERNVKLILDLVINHTGRYNAWFDSFKNAHLKDMPDDPYYNFYSWCGENNIPSNRTFRQIPGTDDYYECNFSDDMPELNFDDEFVFKTILEVAEYYLDLGIDGFRFDAAKYVYFGNNPENIEFWNRFMQELRSYKPDIYTVAEVWDTDEVICDYYDAMNCFNFAYSQQSGLIAKTAGGGNVNKLTSYVGEFIERTASLNPDAMPIPFISNHDMDRAAGYLAVNTGRMQMAANLYILCPGSPFIYYGEELGLRGSRGASNSDANRRLAMPWGDGDTVQNPRESTYGSDKQITDTVISEKADGNSLYSYYKHLIMIRKANPEIACGTYAVLDLGAATLGGFSATLDNHTIIVIHNTDSISASIDLSSIAGINVTKIRASAGAGGAELKGTVLTLDGQTSVVLD